MTTMNAGPTPDSAGRPLAGRLDGRVCFELIVLLLLPVAACVRLAGRLDWRILAGVGLAMSP